MEDLVIRRAESRDVSELAEWCHSLWRTTSAAHHARGLDALVAGQCSALVTELRACGDWQLIEINLRHEKKERHMAIIGAHMLLYSSEADALRAMLRDVFGFESVDAGGGWLIFALPPSELGVHPAEGATYE